ncbi:hypothetical protein FA15DRAFT_84624 [Coprinopsis marcescibilis]|uniref:Mitochondrial inner membrane protease ATP23 n=1 Tax=Coprinopsis marcescibilis TaxID=230819 RepID=A0A5C3KZC8_COPMA|nr:hypothetical protein FA15DRAFT_84624 [Coprinopsis marcescibilis]
MFPGSSPSNSAGSSSEPSSSKLPQDPSNLSAFEKWRRKAMLVTGLGVTDEERMQDLQESRLHWCEKDKQYLMHSSPSVVFMLKQLKLAGCDVPSQNIVCAPCDLTRSGGFEHKRGAVVLCAGNFFNTKHMENTFVHELVHMFDQCRFKVDWTNLRHHACSEIRANNLSGDCRYARELRRGFFTFSKQHQACVRRRAVESVMNNPGCPNEAAAERAVNEVWDSCFNDTRPFDEVSSPSSSWPSDAFLMRIIVRFISGAPEQIVMSGAHWS